MQRRRNGAAAPIRRNGEIYDDTLFGLTNSAATIKWSFEALLFYHLDPKIMVRLVGFICN